MRNPQRLTPYVLLSVIALATGLGIGLGLSEAPSVPGRPLTMQGHGTFGDCSAKTTMVTASINRQTFRRGQSLTVALTAKNEGRTDCQYGGAIQGRVADIGPCGATPLVILNASHHDVWPGTGPYFCPLLSEGTLQPGQTAHAQGRWDLTEENGTSVPPGRYTVDVAIWIRFPIVVSRSTNSGRAPV